MGKASIISNHGGGEYTIKVLYGENLSKDIDRIDNNISVLEAKESRTSEQELQLTASRLYKKYLDKAANQNSRMRVWCADLTEDLTGTVGTVEIPGDLRKVNIKPGFSDSAAYDYASDGVMMQTALMTPEQAFLNAALNPGVQKWYPGYRIGTISNLSENTCTVILDATLDRAGFDVNDITYFNNVIIDYMDCDGDPFVDGDSVLVAFTGRNRAAAKVIGFSTNPRECPDCDDPEYVFEYSDTNPETIDQDDSVTITINGGFAPYNWTVEGNNGEGFTLESETTTATGSGFIDNKSSNTLYASEDVRGSATITVTDFCGTEISGSVRCEAGTWAFICYNERFMETDSIYHESNNPPGTFPSCPYWAPFLNNQNKPMIGGPNPDPGCLIEPTEAIEGKYKTVAGLLFYSFTSPWMGSMIYTKYENYYGDWWKCYNPGGIYSTNSDCINLMPGIYGSFCDDASYPDFTWRRFTSGHYSYEWK